MVVGGVTIPVVVVEQLALDLLSGGNEGAVTELKVHCAAADVFHHERASGAYLSDAPTQRAT